MVKPVTVTSLVNSANARDLIGASNFITHFLLLLLLHVYCYNSQKQTFSSLPLRSNHIILNVVYYVIGNFRGQSDGRLPRCSQRDRVQFSNYFYTLYIYSRVQLQKLDHTNLSTFLSCSFSSVSIQYLGWFFFQ